jgi:hypothetical protein
MREGSGTLNPLCGLNVPNVSRVALETRRPRLREFRPGDLDGLAAIFADPLQFEAGPETEIAWRVEKKYWSEGVAGEAATPFGTSHTPAGTSGDCSHSARRITQLPARWRRRSA